jgi:hypothetical protein
VLEVTPWVQELLKRAPDCRGRAGLVQVRLATLRQEGGAVAPQGIAGDKQHPLCQRGELPLQEAIEGASIKRGHLQVTHEDVIGMGREPGQGLLPIRRRLDRVAIPLQQPCQASHKAWLVINK